MRVKIFEPFEKVWTPRTPDSGYSSLGAAPPGPFVLTPLEADTIDSGLAMTQIYYYLAVVVEDVESILGSGTLFISGNYQAAVGAGTEPAGSGVTFYQGTYTP